MVAPSCLFHARDHCAALCNTLRVAPSIVAALRLVENESGIPHIGQSGWELDLDEPIIINAEFR